MVFNFAISLRPTIAVKVLLLEDEQLTAADLQATLKEIDPGIEVVAVLDSVEGAVQWIQTNPPPDLAFFDVHLADGSSLEVFKEVDFSFPVVFCTAYEEYAFKGFQTNGIAYVLKPFSEHAIRNALDKVAKFKQFLAPQQTGPVYRTHFLVPHKDRLVPIPIERCLCFVIEDELCFLYDDEGKRHLLSQSLDELEAELDPKEFFRANRQHIVQKRTVVEAQHHHARKLLVKLSPTCKKPIVISKAKAGVFLKWMKT